MSADPIESAIVAVPTGAWAVGVSGGADSVALLRMVRARSDLTLVVAHLNHQTRGQASDDDEAFVRSLSAQLGVECHIAHRANLEASIDDLPTNPSARYRQLRLAHYRAVIASVGLQGVILAHHADDQAETIFQRLLRGAGFAALGGMSKRTTLAGIAVLRPFLELRRSALREYLRSINATWREDASNESPEYLRNRIRVILNDQPDLMPALLSLGRACSALRDWVGANARQLEGEFAIGELLDQPAILIRSSASQWLRAIGVPREEIDRGTCERLIGMCEDAAAPSRHQFPGGITVRRRAGKVTSSLHASQKSAEDE